MGTGSRPPSGLKQFGELLQWLMDHGVGRERSRDPKRPTWSQEALSEFLEIEERQLRRWLKNEVVISESHFQGVVNKMLGSADREPELYKRLREARSFTRRYRREISQGEAHAKDQTDPLRWSKPIPVHRHIGRDALRNAVIEVHKDNAATHTIILGGPGIGKTTLALDVSNDQLLLDRFGVRRCLVRLDEVAPSDGQDMLRVIAVALGLDPAHPITSIKKSIGNHDTLLVLDNLETVWEPDADGCEHALLDLAAVPNLCVICTMRGAEWPRPIDWAKVVDVGRLEPPFDRELFLSISRIEDTTADELDLLVQALDGLPLAIELMAEVAQYTPLNELWKQWQAKRTKLLNRRGGRTRLNSLDLSIEISLESTRVTAEGRNLFKILGRLPAGLANCDLDAVCDGDPFQAVSSLRKTKLVESRGDRLHMLVPVREHAAGLELRQELEYQLCKHFLSLIHEYGPDVGREGTRGGVQRLIPETSNLQEMMVFAANSTMIKDAVEEVTRFANFQRFSGFGSPEVFFQVANACMRSEDLAGQGMSIFRAGEIFLHRAEYSKARSAFEQAMPVCEAAGRMISVASCIKCLGDIELFTGRLESALERFSEASSIYEKENVPLGVANCLAREGEVHLERNDLQAIEKFSLASVLYEKAADILGQTNCRRGIAEASLTIDNAEGTLQELKHCLDVYERLGDLEGQGVSLISTARAYQLLDDKVNAYEAAEEALTLFEQVGNYQWIGLAKRQLSELTENNTDSQLLLAEAQEIFDLVGRIDLSRPKQ